MIATQAINELILEAKFGDDLLFQIKNTPQRISREN